MGNYHKRITNSLICVFVSFSILLTADFLNAESSQRNSKIKLILNSTYEIEGKIFTLKNGSYSDYDDKTGEGMRVIATSQIF